MGNDPVNKSNEEEYEFMDSEHSSNFGSINAKSSSSTSLNPPASEGKKKIFLIIGAAVAIFCLYKLVDVFSASPVKKTETPTVTAKSTPAPVSAEEAKPEVVAPPASTEITRLQDKVGTLERVVSKVSQTNANLQDQMAGVATSMADIQNNLSTLTQQISDMEKAKEKLAEDTKKESATPIEKTKTKSAKTHKKRIAAVSRKLKVTQPAQTSYYIKAMIQGRVWLMTLDGASVTVAVGDNLPGYGEVSNIDTTKGEITTTSGKVIGYRADDK